MKLATGSTHLWRWEAPEPVAPGSTPTLVVRRGADAIDGIDALAPVVAPATVTAISTDKKRLTLSAPLVGADRAAGPRWGAAWLVTPSDGAFPVRVSGISTAAGVTTVALADPLPRRPAGAASSLQWAIWTTIFGPEVTAAAARDIVWSVTWQPVHAGGAASAETEGCDEGRIIICRRPFSTGLTSLGLGRVFTDLGQTTAARDNGRQEAIAAALDEIEIDLAPHLGPRGLYPDDIDGHHLRLAHAHLAAAVLVARSAPKRADQLRAQYAALLEKGLRAVWVDLDRDGIVDAGEEEVALSGPVPLEGARLSDLFSRPAPRAPLWGRGRYH